MAIFITLIIITFTITFIIIIITRFIVITMIVFIFIFLIIINMIIIMSTIITMSTIIITTTMIIIIAFFICFLSLRLHNPYHCTLQLIIKLSSGSYVRYPSLSLPLRCDTAMVRFEVAQFISLHTTADHQTLFRQLCPLSQPFPAFTL